MFSRIFVGPTTIRFSDEAVVAESMYNFFSSSLLARLISLIFQDI